MGKDEDIILLKAADKILRRHGIYVVALSMLIVDLSTDNFEYVEEIPT